MAVEHKAKSEVIGQIYFQQVGSLFGKNIFLHPLIFLSLLKLKHSQAMKMELDRQIDKCHTKSVSQPQQAGCKWENMRNFTTASLRMPFEKNNLDNS